LLCIYTILGRSNPGQPLKNAAEPSPQEVWLIYPANTGFGVAVPDFVYSQPGPRLRALPLDLEKRR